MFVSGLQVLVEVSNVPPICSLTHILECPCLFATQYKKRLPDYFNVMEQFKKVEREIVR